jgi:hypothetical protein
VESECMKGGGVRVNPSSSAMAMGIPQRYPTPASAHIRVEDNSVASAFPGGTLRRMNDHTVGFFAPNPSHHTPHTHTHKPRIRTRHQESKVERWKRSVAWGMCGGWLDQN